MREAKEPHELQGHNNVTTKRLKSRSQLTKAEQNTHREGFKEGEADDAAALPSGVGAERNAEPAQVLREERDQSEGSAERSAADHEQILTLLISIDVPGRE